MSSSSCNRDTPDLSDAIGFLQQLNMNGSVTIPDGAACWICLDEGADENGKPLVRDCSCRGDSAGFAHLSCIIQYAEQKSEDVVNSKRENEFSLGFYECPNCTQKYQNELSLELSTAFISFTKRKYAYPGNSIWDQIRVMEALRLKSIVITGQQQLLCKPNHRNEGKLQLKKMLSMIEKMLEHYKLNTFLHKPKNSSQYQLYQFIRDSYEAYGHNQLGVYTRIDMEQKSVEGMSIEEGGKIANNHFKKALIIYKILNNERQVRNVEANIAKVEAIVRGDDDLIAQMKRARQQYDDYLQTGGESDEKTIQSGMVLAETLLANYHGIEAHRLATSLATISHRFHGLEHESTKNANKIMSICSSQSRSVISLHEPGKIFEALRYENSEEVLVVKVKGPITKFGNIEGGQSFKTASDGMIPYLGCAVVCHGLRNASHLNGKLGDVRAISATDEGLRFTVHFDIKSIKPALVKLQNLRIFFDVQDRE